MMKIENKPPLQENRKLGFAVERVPGGCAGGPQTDCVFLTFILKEETAQVQVHTKSMQINNAAVQMEITDITVISDIPLGLDYLSFLFLQLQEYFLFQQA